MKIKTLFITTMMATLSVTTYAQIVETFCQPYPLGDKLSPIRISRAKCGLLL